MGQINEVSALPFIDSRVKYVGVAKLRTLNLSALKKLDVLLVLQDNEQPLAVVIPFAMFLEIQDAMTKLKVLLEMIERRVGEKS